jgi:hypothetical protein
MALYHQTINPESLWGALYEPDKPKQANKPGIRTVLFVSCNCGDQMIKNLALFEKKYPDDLNIVGIVTDDPVDPNARISIKKRIWSQYAPAEHQELLFKIICTAASLGVPCYSGAVKTDYFRALYQSWNPDVMLMFCFGQWIDSMIYDFPVMGSYNFHPSDLPKKMGAGTQPFQNAIKNGLKTSPLVIHQVTELIDMGPITGISPPINICLADGSYPASLLTLLDKITSFGGWMGVELIGEVIKRRKAGLNGPVGFIDFDRIIPAAVKGLLLSPAVNDLNETYEVPLHPILR